MRCFSRPLPARVLALALGLAFAAVPRLLAYVPLAGSPVWPDGNIVMHLQLGASTTLSDGKTWNTAATDMLAEWNQTMARSQFTTVPDSSVSVGDGNRVNNVLFSSTIFGRTFGADTLAVTTIWTLGGRRIEGDVLFNSRFRWDSYRGPLRAGANSAEFSRTALHEFGHLVGLDHPDVAGQSVSAIMNSRAGNLDALTADDRDGAAFLYASNAGTSAPLAPAILLALADQFPVEGDNVDFAVAASGTGPFAYQWARNGVVQSATTAQWTLANVTGAHSGQWTVTVSNGRGSVTSAMNLTVTARAVAPTITRQPSPVSTRTGQSVSFTVAASGSTPRTYQWRKDGTPLGVATVSETLTLTDVQLTDAGAYSVVVRNAGGSVTSADATLAVALPNTPAAIASPPTSTTAAIGFEATFTATVTGTAPTTYRWSRNGVPLAGASGTVATNNPTATLTLPRVTASDAGNYTVTVTNPFGSAASPPATLFVAPVSTAGHLFNLAIRSLAGTGSETLIVGFTLAGGQGTPQRLLLRAVGPTLAVFGVTGTLADPRLDLYSGPTLTVSNDDWSGNAAVSLYGSRVGAFALSGPTSKDSALIQSLATGSYSAQVAGAGTGVALAEIYDASDAYTDLSLRFTNLSARTRVGTGGDILIAGFALAGTTPKTLLIRAIGPTLASFGVTGALADPLLEVYRGAEKIAENDNWPGTSELQSSAATVGAFFLPIGSKDAVLILTLPAGTYSAQVRGANATTGVALVEVYELP
jgi:hypothetical protein